MASGTVTLNSIDDTELIKVLEIQKRSNGKLIFSPNSALQTVVQSTGPSQKQVFNNVSLHFSTAEGAKYAGEVMHSLSGENQIS